jgi:hypothetical protein
MAFNRESTPIPEMPSEEMALKRYDTPIPEMPTEKMPPEKRYIFKWFEDYNGRSGAYYFAKAKLPLNRRIYFNDKNWAYVSIDEALPKECKFIGKGDFDKVENTKFFNKELDKTSSAYKTLFNEYFNCTKRDREEGDEGEEGDDKTVDLIKIKKLCDEINKIRYPPEAAGPAVVTYDTTYFNQDDNGSVEIRSKLYSTFGKTIGKFLKDSTLFGRESKTCEELLKYLNEKAEYKLSKSKPQSKKPATVKPYHEVGSLTLSKKIASLLQVYESYGIDKNRAYIDMFSYTAQQGLQRLFYYEAIIAFWSRDNTKIINIVNFLNPEQSYLHYEKVAFIMSKFHRRLYIKNFVNVELTQQTGSLKKILCEDLTTKLNSRIRGNPLDDDDMHQLSTLERATSAPEQSRRVLRERAPPPPQKKKKELYQIDNSEDIQNHIKSYINVFNTFATAQVKPPELENIIQNANIKLVYNGKTIQCCCYICGRLINQSKPASDHILPTQTAFILNLQYLPLLYAPTHTICNGMKSESIASFPYDDAKFNTFLKEKTPSERERAEAEIEALKKLLEERKAKFAEFQSTMSSGGELGILQQLIDNRQTAPLQNKPRPIVPTRHNLPQSEKIIVLKQSLKQFSNSAYLKIFKKTLDNLRKIYEALFINLTNENIFKISRLLSVIKFLDLEIQILASFKTQTGGAPTECSNLRTCIFEYFKVFADKLDGNPNARSDFWKDHIKPCMEHDEKVNFYIARLHIFAIYSYKLYEEEYRAFNKGADYTYDKYLYDRIIILTKNFTFNSLADPYPAL